MRLFWMAKGALWCCALFFGVAVVAALAAHSGSVEDTAVLIKLSDIPAWGSLAVAAAGLWQAYKARLEATNAKLEAAKAVVVVDETKKVLTVVTHQIDGMRTALEEAARAKGELAGRKDEKQEQKEARRPTGSDTGDMMIADPAIVPQT